MNSNLPDGLGASAIFLGSAMKSSENLRKGIRIEIELCSLRRKCALLLTLYNFFVKRNVLLCDPCGLEL